jgi:hypothetical protein
MPTYSPEYTIFLENVSVSSHSVHVPLWDEEKARGGDQENFITVV